jgi:hypothetical protein
VAGSDALSWVAAVGGISAVVLLLLTLWWRRPQLHVEAPGDWKEWPQQGGEVEWVALTVLITNDGDAIVRGVKVVGRLERKPLTPIERVDVPPGQRLWVDVRFPPGYVAVPAPGEPRIGTAVMPLGQLTFRVTAGRWGWRRWTREWHRLDPATGRIMPPRRPRPLRYAASLASRVRPKRR